MKKKLTVISNERFSKKGNNFFCDNIAETLPDDLEKNFDVKIICRYASSDRAHQLKVSNIKRSKNFLSYAADIFNSVKIQKSTYLALSISPYTFLGILLLYFLKQKTIVYLRSDGYEEYKSKFGLIGKFIYHLMFSIISKTSELIGCNDRVLKNLKGKIVYPSTLTDEWFLNKKPAEVKTIRMLYVGRMRVEKGIFSFIKILNENKKPFLLSIVGADSEKYRSLENENIKVYGVKTNTKDLINLYDQHNVFVLPSFTEGHPMVVLEALARERPIIIFKEIEHIVKDKKGIFVSDRNTENFFQKLDYILDNYQDICSKIKENKLPTKKQFVSELISHISL
mgnify:FL=1